MVIHAADAYTITRVQIGIREGRAALRFVKVEGGYRLGGQTGPRGEAVILFGKVLTHAEVKHAGAKRWRTVV